jgi:hypothetical protein
MEIRRWPYIAVTICTKIYTELFAGERDLKSFLPTETEVLERNEAL